MTELSFQVVDDRPEPHAAVPTLMLRVRVDEADGGRVHALALRCQIRIEPQRRRYTPEEEVRLYELFGSTPQWGDSLRPFLWTHVSTVIAGFDATTEFDLPVECSYDLEVAGAKYMHALGQGEIPLLLLFSGTVFTPRADSGFAAERVSWGAEAKYRLPVATWRQVIDLYYPNSAWLRIHDDTLERLQAYRAARGLTTWDEAFERLLKAAGEEG